MSGISAIEFSYSSNTKKSPEFLKILLTKNTIAGDLWFLRILLSEFIEREKISYPQDLLIWDPEKSHPKDTSVKNYFGLIHFWNFS